MRRRIWAAMTLAAAFGLVNATARADVKPHALFSDGLVLQQGVKCPIWGLADAGELVSVTFEAKKPGTATAIAAAVTADQDGKWKVSLQIAPSLAGGPYSMTIKGKNNTIALKDVYVGEVWVCSGQSNMEFHLNSASNAKEAIDKAKNPMIRLFTVPRATSDKPLNSFKGDLKWQECDRESAAAFSAVGYFFGRDLQKALKVPVGLIHTSWGGTRAEAWSTRAALENNADLKSMLEQYDKAQASAKTKNSPHRPAVLYNAMIHPLQPYAIKGVIWYQGEANASRAYQYRTLFPTMIQSWRESWKQGDFPFLFVQLAPFRAIVAEPQESDWAELREAQLLTSLKLKNTGMAVITDVGNPKDIHPKRKEPVGARLALAARGIAYGENIEYSGPLYDKMTVKDGKAVLTFKHAGKGLQAKDGELKGFAIAGKDKKFHNAKAEIQGDTVLVWSDEVKEPVAVRYGWADCPVVNLWNKDGLPASPFRTDDFAMKTAPKTAK